MNSVCESCFEDKELKGFIFSQGEIKKCDFCGSDDKKAIPIDELLDFFKNFYLISNHILKVLVY